MTDYKQLDKKAKELYQTVLQPLADRLAFELPHNTERAVRRPTALFLGNHSSGKSSFINHLLGSSIQKTGLAPTDDGFTIITHGDNDDSIDGQTVASHPELAFHDLDRLGPAFISRLRLRAIPNPLLQEINMIDSPGMIDAVDRSNTREYDFHRSIRIFAENADLILFFFDPDKPGTTAETIDALTNTLAGLEHKLMIVMNKVDLFSTMRDFARSYGTLCWNLSKAITTKDIPHIFTTYLPELANRNEGQSNQRIPLSDFDDARDEIVTEIKRAPTRRADNIVSDLLQTARMLSIHTRVCDRIGTIYRQTQLRWYGTGLVLVIGTALGGWQLWDRLDRTQLGIGIGSGLLITVIAIFLGRHQLQQLRSSLARVEALDGYFEQAFQDEITLGERLDLRAMWKGLRENMSRSLKVLSPAKFPLKMTRNRHLKRLNNAIECDIPRLRRHVGG
jgi:hypothetical protein